MSDIIQPKKSCCTYKCTHQNNDGGGEKNTHVVYIQLYMYVTLTLALVGITTEGGGNIHTLFIYNYTCMSHLQMHSPEEQRRGKQKYTRYLYTIIHVCHTYTCTRRNNDGGGGKYIYVIYI